MLDEQELLATRVLNKKATWNEIQAFIDKNYVKRSELEEVIERLKYDVKKTNEIIKRLEKCVTSI